MAEEEDLGGSMAVYGLPRSYWHCTLANFRWDLNGPPELRETVEGFARTVKAGGKGGNPHLLLLGLPGRGKSHLGVAVWRAVVEEVGTQRAIWVNVPDFCDTVKRSYDGGPDPFRDFELAKRLVVLDDIFGRELTPHEASTILFRAINIAYENDAAVLLNLNQSLETLGSRLPGHELSRVLAGAQGVTVTSDMDYRRRA